MAIVAGKVIHMFLSKSREAGISIKKNNCSLLPAMYNFINFYLCPVFTHYQKVPLSIHYFKICYIIYTTIQRNSLY